jgi:hypothetical protein
MNIDSNRIENDFLSDLLHYINEEKFKMNFSKNSNSEFKFISPDDSIIVKFLIDIVHHKILYDVYLSDYKKHLKERTLYNFDKMYSLQRQYGKRHLPEYMPDLWMILDEIHVWAKKTNFTITGKEFS